MRWCSFGNLVICLQRFLIFDDDRAERYCVGVFSEELVFIGDDDAVKE